MEFSREEYGGREGEVKLRRELEARITRKDDLTLISGHPQGGNPLSDEKGIGVVGSDFRVKGMDNVFVCDASVFPAAVRVNPQLSVMALADYFVRRSGCQ